jgi:hypothetical protein
MMVVISMHNLTPAILSFPRRRESSFSQIPLTPFTRGSYRLNPHNIHGLMGNDKLLKGAGGFKAINTQLIFGNGII